MNKLIYVCSPYRGDTETNTKNAREYCRRIVAEGNIPIAPHLLFPQFMDDNIDTERERAMEMNLRQNEQILNSISKSLEPKSRELKDKIAEAKEKQNLITKIEIIEELMKEYNDDLSEQEIDTEEKAPYDPKKKFTKEEVVVLNT